jgi:hypothetical protein
LPALRKSSKAKKFLAGRGIWLSLRSWKEHWMKKKRKDRGLQLKALKKESERNLIEQIRRQLALPMNRRTNFLRKRLPGGGSCL